MSWDQAVAAHAAMAAKLYPPEKLAAIARECGLDIRPDGSNSAASRDDVDRYVEAVAKVLGPVAATSAKLKVSNSLRTLRLA